MKNNKITLIGKITSAPKYDYTLYGEDYLSFSIGVLRDSGVMDDLQLTCSERLINYDDYRVGQNIGISGSIRTYNERNENANHLKVYVFVEDIYAVDAEASDENTATIEGYICSKQQIRQTPFGRTICDIVLANNNRYKKSYYIPCILWGRNARYIDKKNVGDQICITGRLQSRQYTKCDEIKTAYEFSVQRMECIR